MKKLVKNWVFIFAFSLVVICLAFYVFMLGNAIRQPSKRWSREISIAEIDNDKISESTRPRIVTVPLQDENRCMIFWNERNALKLTTVDSHGNIGTKKTILIQLGEPVKMEALRVGSKIYFYLMESGKIKQYDYDYKKGTFHYMSTLADNANDFILYNGNLFVVSDHDLSMIDLSGAKNLLVKPGGQKIDIFMDQFNNKDDRYNIALASSDEKTKMFIKYCEYNVQKKKSRVFTIATQSLGINEMSGFDTLLIAGCGSKINIMASRKLQIPDDTCRRKPKGVVSRALLYTFDRTSLPQMKVTTKLVNDVSYVEPNPVKNYSSDQKLGFISSTITNDGPNSSSINLMQYELVNGKIIEKELLTKTKDISREPFWFKLDNKEFLQWEDRSGNGTTILFASTDPAIIHKAGRITLMKAWNTLLDTTMPLGFSLSYLLLLFSCIMLPTFIFIVAIAIFFINWAENHNRSTVNLACGIHAAAEIAMVVFFDWKKTEVISIEPALLQNPFGKLFLTVAIAGVSYYCMLQMFRDGKYDKSFINQYIFFAITNMLMFALLIFPYYYL